MKAALYVRVSTEDQAREGFSISAQVNLITEYCIKNDIEVYKVYSDEGITGQIEQRPYFQQMLHDADKKLFSIIIVHKFDRFARKVELSQRIKKQLKSSNVNVISITEPIEDSPIGFFQEGILELLAEYYVRNLSAEVKKGLNEKVKQGLAINMMAYGYKNIKGKVVLVEEQANIVKQIYEMYGTGIGTSKIASYLNTSDIPTMKPGGKWNTSQINYILRNITYTGTLKWKEILIEDCFEPIIPREYFARIQNIVGSKSNSQPYRNINNKKFMLLEIIRCGYCKAPMRISTMKSGKNVYNMYSCRRARYNKDLCSHSTLYRNNVLEKHIIDYIKEILENPELDIDVEDTKINEVYDFMKNKKIKLQKELERGKKAYLSEVFSLEEYVDMRDKATAELAIIEKEEAINDDERKKALSNKLRSKAKNSWEKFLNCTDPGKQKQYLQEFIKTIYITKDNIHIKTYT
jgi:site-specific DNA recombinase